MRTCIGCREIRPARALVRCRLDASGRRAVCGRAAGREAGRSAWLCSGSPDCLTLAVSRRSFARAWKCAVDDEVIDSIRSGIAAADADVEVSVVGNHRGNVREWSAAGSVGTHTGTKG